MQTPLIFWILFNVFVLLVLALDLGVFNRKAQVIGMKKAVAWTLAWIGLALCFNAGIYFWQGKEKALEFLTGYVIEKALSVDNIFVFVMIFSYFSIPAKHQYRILFWGILGALVMRALFIFAGVALMERFHFMTYVFSAILLYAGYKMLVRADIKLAPEKNPVIRAFRKWIPVTDKLHDGKFFARINGKRHATPILLVLIVVETTDILFAIDSIPAILAITQDRFIVYTSNVFAVLGLRSLYFVFSDMVYRFKYLPKGLACILIFVGLKMALADFYRIPTGFALLAIVAILGVSVAASMRAAKNPVHAR